MSNPKKRRYARRITPCAGCGKRGRRIGAKCHNCGEVPSPEVLHDTAGAWVLDPRRRIVVWTPSERWMFQGQWSEGHRRKSAPRGAGTPLRGASPTERNTDRHG